MSSAYTIVQRGLYRIHLYDAGGWEVFTGVHGYWCIFEGGLHKVPDALLDALRLFRPHYPLDAVLRGDIKQDASLYVEP